MERAIMIYLGVSAITSLAIGSLFKFGVNLEMITALMGVMFFIGAFYYFKILNSYDIK